MTVVKGIGHAVGSIVDGVKTVFKSITSSTFGRALMIGAMIFLGGAAFGLWDSGIGAVDGAFTSTAAANAGTATAANEAATTAAAESPAQAAVAEGTAGGTAAGTDTTAATLNASTANAGGVATDSLGTIPSTGNLADAATTYGGTGAGAAPSYMGAATPSASNGFIDSIMKNPLAQYGLIQAGAGAMQGAFTPNAEDIAKQNQQIQQQNVAWMQNFLSPNFQVGSMNLGMTPANKPLTDASGKPVYPVTAPQQGFINQAMIPRTIPVRT